MVLILTMILPVSMPVSAHFSPADANQNSLHLDIGRPAILYHDGDVVHFNVTISIPARDPLANPPFGFYPADQENISCNFTRPDGIIVILPVIPYMSANQSYTFTHANDGTNPLALDTGLDYVIKHINEDATHQVTAYANSHATSHSSFTEDDNDQANNIKVKVYHPGLNVEKTADAISKVGDEVTYHITVSNTGDIPLNRVSVYDTLSGNITTSFPATLGIGASSGLIAFTRTVLATDPNPLINTVTAIYKEEVGLLQVIPVSVTDTASASTDLKDPKYTLTKTADPVIGPLGTLITYTVTMNNTGDLQLDRISAQDSLVGNVVNLFPSSLAAGAAVTINYTRAIAFGDTSPLINTITTVYQAHGLTNQLTRQASAQVTIPGIPHTTMQSISIEPLTIPEGGGTVTITVKDLNDGTVAIPAPWVELTGIPLPSIPVTMTHIAGDPGDTFQPGIMDPNEIWTFTATITIGGSTDFTAVGHGLVGNYDVTGPSETIRISIKTPPKTPASSALTIGLLAAFFTGAIILSGMKMRSKSRV